MRERVNECFFAVQQAWANRDGEALAPYVSESLRASMEQEFDELEAQYLANRLEDLELDEVRLASPPGPGESSFDADVAFSAREWTEDLRTGRPAAGDPDATGLADALLDGTAAGLAAGRRARTGGRSLTTSLKTGAALSKLSGMVPWALGDIGW